MQNEASGGSQVHLLLLSDASTSSDLMTEKLQSRGFHVTNVRSLKVLYEEWRLGLHNVVLLDHSVPLAERLSLLRESAMWHRPMPILMTFETGADQEAKLAIEQGAFACVVENSCEDYRERICDLIQSLAKESGFGTTLALPSGQDDDEADLADLESLAAEVRGEPHDIGTATLVVLGGPDVGRYTRLDATVTVVGRDTSCHLCLFDDAISRRHATFRQLPEGMTFVKDLGSTNGTFVNGKRIKSAILKEGDEILLGKNTLLKLRK
jgi:CheY-like chemotaxis protein